MNAFPPFSLLILFFIIVVLLAVVRRNHIADRRISLLRALFPSWRFFEDLTEVPLLHYRLAFAADEFGPWQLALASPKRAWWTVLFNPAGNLSLAYHSLLQQLESDIGDLSPETKEEFLQSVSYELVRNLAISRIVEVESPPVSFRFQFKVSRVRQESLLSLSDSAIELNTFLVSPIEDVSTQ